MQSADSRTSAPAPEASGVVASEAPLPGSVVEHTRFVEVQQRRARISAEREQSAMRMPRSWPQADPRYIDTDELFYVSRREDDPLND